MLAHGSVLMDKFLDPDALRAVVADHRAADLSDVDIAVMEFAGKIVEDASSVEQADIERLRSAGLSDEDILDVALAATARCFFSKTLDALGAQPDAKYAELDPEIRDALTIGRAIAAR
jgi:alkylhydroperoxidase family enzyme